MGATPVQAEILPIETKTVGSGWYAQKQWNTTIYGETEPTSLASNYGTCEYWKKLFPSHSHTTSFSAGQSISGVYFIKGNITVNAGTGTSGLVVNGTAVLVFEDGASLTVKGGNASGQTGAGAGIQLTSGNTLVLFGKGTISATGGNPANGSAGSAGESKTVGSGGNGGYGGGGGGAGIGSKGANGGNANGGNGGSSAGGGTLLTGSGSSVGISATGGAWNSLPAKQSGGIGPSILGSGGGGGAGGSGGNANNIGAGGYGGGGGGRGGDGKKINLSYYGGGGGGSGAGSNTGYAGGGGLCTTGSAGTGSQGGTGPGASGGAGGSSSKGYSGGTGGSAGTYGSGVTQSSFWDADACKFELVEDTATGWNAENKAWMYTGSTIYPKIKVTNLSSGEVKYAQNGTNGYGVSTVTGDPVYGSTNGYCRVFVGDGQIPLKQIRYTGTYNYGGATVGLYFPIKEKIEFDNNATAEIEILTNNGLTGDDATVKNTQDSKVVQRGVTEKTDAVLATANVPTLHGYEFLGWYYYDSNYFNTDGTPKSTVTQPLESGKTSEGRQIYNENGKLTATGYLNSNGTWNGVNTDEKKAIVKLYAAWREAKFTLTLDAQGGQGGSSQNNLNIGDYVQVNAPTKPGSTFDGYYTGRNGTGDLYCYTDDEGNMLYRYTLQSDSSTSVSGKDATGADATYAKGEMGYFTQNVINTDSSKGGGIKMLRSVTLYAKWAPLEYDVTLYSYDDGNEAAGDAGSAHLVGTLKNVRYGTLRVPNVDDETDVFVTETDGGKKYGVLDTTLNMVRKHYDFIGWNLYDGQDWAMFKPNEIYKTGLIQTTADGKSKALYAAWKIKDNYKITYNGNGGKSTTLTGNVFKGEDYTVTEEVPQYSGHSFVAWNTAPNGSGTTYKSGDEITGVTENITLYAQWEENKSVIYNTNGGTANTSLEVLKPAKGETVALDFDTNIIKSGYTFVGWDTNPYGKDGTKESPTKEATYTADGTSSYEMGDKSVTLYAIWAPQQYNITYAAVSTDQAARYTQTLQPDKYYHLETYKFDVRVDTSKWGTNEMKVSINNQSIGIPTPETDGDTAIYTFKIQGATGDQAIKIGGLTARSYNVSLDAKGGTIAAEKNVTYYVSGETKTLPIVADVTRTGYTFDGWYDGVDESGNATGHLVSAIGYDETGDKKFYAKWSANSYTVKYDANGGTGAPSDTGMNATYDADYTILGQGSMTYSDATVEFLGWSTNQDAVAPEYLAGNTVKNLATGADADLMITLYAVWKVPTYTISYMLGGGTAGGNGSILPQEVKAGASATIADLEMKKTGYTFRHWKDNDEGNTTYANGAMILNVVANHILEAVWEPGTYSIEFINPKDEVEETKTKTQSSIKYGESVALETNTFTSKEGGYTEFLGWATTETAAIGGTRTPQYLDGQKVMNLSETDGDTVKLYAVWGNTPVKYLNYDANGGTYSGSTPAVQPASDGKAIVQFTTTPTKEGYTFQGWKTADGTHVYTESMSEAERTVALESSVTLYADWKANTYTVTYKPNFTGDAVPDDKTQEIEYDKTVQLDANTFAREHYNFLGWSEDEDATAPTYQNQQSVLNLPVTEIADGAKGITLYAVWQAESSIYLTYNANGGTGAPASESIYAGESVTLSSVEPAHEGYTFLGWATSSTATTAEYEKGTEISSGFNRSTTLYAVWEKKQAHTVSYDANGGYGSVPVDSTGYYEGDSVTVRFNPIPMRSGYTFSGWSRGDDIYSYNAESANTVTFEMGTDDVTLQAKWTPNTYTIIFKNDTEEKRQENVKYDTATALTANSFNAPTGKKFAGWATNDGGSVKYEDKAEVTGLTGVANGEVTLYAVWEPIAVTITFNQQEGTGGSESATATYGQQLPSAAAPSREGYTFGGYWTEQNGGGTQYYGDYMNALKNVDFTSDTILYAKWTAKTYKVTYMYGTEILLTDALTYGNTTAIRNESVIGEKMPEGMKLSGWAKTDNGTVAYTAGQTDVELWNGGNDVVLYAILKKDVKYTVTYVPGYGTTFPVDTTQYEDGDTVTVELANNQPAQYGYTFLGWSDVPNAPTAKYSKDGLTQFPIHDNTTLYGVWSVGTYKVTYDGNGGTESFSEGTNANVLENVEMLSYSFQHPTTIYTKAGYSLLGWAQSKDKADLGQIDFAKGQVINPDLTTKAGAEVTLYAVWQANKYTVTFDPNNADATVSETEREVTYGEKYGSAFPTPTLSGRTFLGWFTQAEGGTQVKNTDTVAITGNQTLYAHWNTIQYQITTTNNGVGTVTLTKPGTATTPEEITGGKADAGAEITVTVTPRNNYTIDNVKLYVNGTPVAMTEGTDGSNGTYTFTLKQNTEIALEENSNIGIKYTVEYKGNGGIGEIQSVSAVSGKTFALASEGFTMNGSALSGWNTMQGGTGKAYTLGETVKDLTLEPGGTVTLYAQWSENNPAGYTYTIRYEANGGVGTAYEQQMQQNRLNVALYDGAGFSRAGWALVGWANTTGGAVDYQLGGKLSAPLASQEGAVKTLYAVWQKGAIRVTLNDAKGVNTVTSLVLNTGDTYSRLPNLSLAGWTFDGWFTEGGERVDNSTEVTAISDHTLYAHWTAEAAKTYTVTVLADPTLGTITLNPAGGKYAAGTEVIATATPATGKTIKVISSSGEIPWSKPGDYYTGTLAVTQDITLILVDATQVTDNTWYLFYNANGGSGSMDVEMVNNTTARAKASTFSRDGYEFAGWKDGNGTAYEVDGTVTKPTNSKVLTLYAQWEATADNTYTVTFDAQGGNMTEANTRTYHAGDKYGTLPTPVKSGDWSFGGWYSDSAFATRVYDTTTIQSRNHTLYAKWVSRTAVAVTAVGYDGEYDGVAHALTATPSKTLTGATYQWFKDGNAVQGAIGKTLYVKNVADSGNYTCVVSGSYNGVGYTGMESTTAVVNITKKALTITAADAAVVYGADAPAYALSYSGFAAADNAGVLEGEATIDCAYVKGNNAGSYPINVGAENLVAANYDVNVVRGTLTVKPLPVALEWSGTKLEHTGEAQSITATVKNAVGEDTFTLAYDGNTETDVNTPDGSYYTATVTGLGNDNYTLTGATGKVHNWVIYAQGTDPGTVPDPVQPDEETTEVVTGITLDPTTKTVEEDETFTLTYTLQPDGATDTVSFSSSDAGIASVDEYGTVTAVKAGTAVITAKTSSGLTASCTVNVNAKASEDSIPVTGLTVQYTSYKMTKSGQTFNIGAKVTPSNAANQGITYSSSNNAVATVDSTGKVTAISGGSAVIYAQTVDGGYTLVCNVTVEIKNSSSGGSGGGGSSSGGSSGGSSSGSSSGSKTDGKTDDQTNNGTTGGNTKGGSISAGGTGNTAYSGCEHESDCPIHPFTDAYTDAWYHNGVHYCIDNDLMGGYGDDLFGPNDKITRAQIAMILWHIAGSPTVNHAMSFKDVPEGEWYTEAVRWATDIGVASGYSDDQFGPNDSITREQFAAMLYRFAQLQGKDTSRGNTNTLRGFADVSKISAYALPAMQWANGTEIISGVDTSTLDPQGYATRAQAACMIQRYILNPAE